MSISSNMATTRRYSVIGRCRVPLSAHSHQLNPVSSKNVGQKNFSCHLIKNKTSMSPQEKTSKSYLCTPDIYTKERSICPVLRPQVSKCPIFLPCNFLCQVICVQAKINFCTSAIFIAICQSFFRQNVD